MDYPQFTVRVTAEDGDNLLWQSLVVTRSLFAILGLIILVPVALGVLNTLTINVLERSARSGWCAP